MSNPHVLITDPKQIEALESITRVDEKGYLYHMNCEYDYNKLPPEIAGMLKAGCSVFITRNREGDVLFCRNYDFSHYPNNLKANGRTGLNMIVEGNNPNAKFRTIGVGDSYWLDFAHGSYKEGVCDDGKTDLSPFVLCPYLCMDGMNENGLAICILSLLVRLDWQPIDYDTYEEKLNANKDMKVLENPGEQPNPYALWTSMGHVAVNHTDKKAWIATCKWIRSKIGEKPAVLHPVLMRMVLDNCRTVDEALAVMDQFNIAGAMPGADYHLMVADASGKSCIVEWEEDRRIVTPIDHATNHWVSKDDPFFPDGCKRDDCIVAGMNRFRKGGMTIQQVESLFNLVIQDPDNNNGDGKTQYSCIYNLTKKNVRVYSYGDTTKCWEYSL